MTPIENILLAASVLLLLSIFASKASGGLGIPALLLFLSIGMLAGSDGLGGIYFDDPWVTQLIGVMALAFILFDGGLATDLRHVRPVLRDGLLLSSLGVLLTALLVGVFLHFVFQVPLLEGLLIGAIVSSTDAAAVFAVLRSKSVRLKGDLEPLLEFESGTNDPMAVFLTVGLTGMMVARESSLWTLVPMFFWQMTLGGLSGYVLGIGMAKVVNRFRLAFDGLYPVLTIAMVLFTYGITTYLGGSGFLAVYLAGLVMRRHDFLHRRSIMRFHDGLAWLMQIGMFLTLGLLVFPTQLPPIAGAGLLSAAFLILVARPLSVFITLAFSRLSLREKLMVSWVGLRGAAPIILATFPLLAGIEGSGIIFHLVFFIVLTSVLLQGSLIPLVSRWLKVDTPVLPPRPLYPLELVPAASPNSELVEVVVQEDSIAAGKSIVALGLPEGALIVLIHKGEEYQVPSGGTILNAGDGLMVLADRKSLDEVQAILQHQTLPRSKPADGKMKGVQRGANDRH
jgi:potassium/hydrogen antiporter